MSSLEFVVRNKFLFDLIVFKAILIQTKNMFIWKNGDIHSKLSRYYTALGSSKELSWFSPTKVEAHKSFIFTECSLVLKIKNTWLMFVNKLLMT